MLISMQQTGASPLPDMILLTTAETVALIRDLFLVVFLSLAVISLLVFIFFALSLYRRVKRVLDAADEAIERLESVAELLDSVLGATRNVGSVLSITGIVTRLFGRFRRP